VIEADNKHFMIRDLADMENYFMNVTVDNIDNELAIYGNSLRQQLDIPIAEFDKEQSSFYRFIMPPHINRGVQDREYE